MLCRPKARKIFSIFEKILYKISKFKVAILMFKEGIIFLVPSEMFVKNSATHTYFTTQSDYLHVPIIKTTTLQKTILYT